MNGCLEDLSVTDIKTSTNILRSSTANLGELVESINKIGLLQPIVVRTNGSDNFEVVAGNRRLKACKSLGWKKIACHVVELDERTAFEFSIIENLQRHNLDPIEEGQAFRKYVTEFGWGGVSELAEKISKSTSYICKRIKLTELPKDIVDLISKSDITATVGEELLPMADKNAQRKLTEIIQERQLSSRTVRKLVKTLGTRTKTVGASDDSLYRFTGISESEKIQMVFDKIIISLRMFIKKLATIIEKTEDNWIFYDLMMQHKHTLDQQIDLLLKEKRKFKKYSCRLVGHK